jgi:hypothetical protein
MKRSHSTGAIDAAACALLALAVAILYRKVVRLFWMFDDAYLLHTAVSRRLGQYFVDPGVWRSMPNRLFTPLLQFSYDAELSLFGFDARPFYTVHLIELALAGMTLYLLLRLWIQPLFAFGGGLLFLLGAPLASAATELMVMHYVETIILGALAAICWIHSLRRRRIAWSIVSAVVYLGAMLAKEVVVPLPVVLVVIPEDDLRTRARYVTPHGFALLVYAIWRRAMLGEWFGGYGWALTGRDIVPLLVSLPRKLALVLTGPRIAIGALLLIAIAVAAVAALRSWRAWGVTLAGVILAIAPIIPISKEMQPRFALVLWLALAIIAAFACARASRAGVALLAVITVLGIAVNRGSWRDELRGAKRMSDEARVFVALGPDALLRKPAIPPAALGELKWLKEDELHKKQGTGWFYDDLILCRNGTAGKHVWSFVPARGEVLDITSSIAPIAARYCASIRPQAPLSVEFHYRDETLFWQFGPYQEGTYAVVIADGLQAFEVPHQEGFRLGALPGIGLRVRYESPAGWVTYSPDFNLDFVREPDVRWHR